MTSKPVYILNGPNLNLLGTREPEIYGRDTLSDIEAKCADRAKAHGLGLDFRQTNGEGELVSWVQEARGNAAGLVVNPGAYTHTSIALRDALAAVDQPKIELHLSNIHAREEFRRNSYASGVVSGVIMGFGASGYLLALDALKSLLESGKA